MRGGLGSQGPSPGESPPVCLMSVETNRARLISEARRLFAERGFTEVSVEEVAAAAALTKGAVYYQFRDKTDLFRAACEALLAEMDGQFRGRVAGSGHARSIDGIVGAGEAWLDAYESPEARRMLLIDAPAVLGVEPWIALQEPVGMALIAHALEPLADGGLLEAGLIPSLAHLLFGALVQGALRIGAAPDPEAASREVRRATRALTQGLLARPGATVQ
jgi:AcrR family transcriptional regulator